MMKNLILTCLTLASFTAVACAQESKGGSDAEVWTNLLSGSDINILWEGAKKKGERPEKVGERWQLNDGVLSLDFNREGRGGSLETKKKYFNFELKYDYKIAKDCNGGIKYRCKDSLGCEYQLVDDDCKKYNKVEKHRAATLYALKAVPEDRKLNPAGEWNSGRIVANGNQLEHWLNGQKVISVTFGSAEWKEMFEQSKYFKQGKLDFGTHTGPIHLQDHSDTIVEFKNMFIREL